MNLSILNQKIVTKPSEISRLDELGSWENLSRTKGSKKAPNPDLQQ